MKKLVLILIIIFGLLYFFLKGTPKTPSVSVPQRDISLSGKNLLDEVNLYRKDNGLSELSTDTDLCYRIMGAWEEIQAVRNSRKVPEADEGQKLEKILNDFVDLNAQNGAYKGISELKGIFGGGENVVETVKGWKGYSGTAGILLNKDINIGCGFGKDGTSVFQVGKRT